MAEAHLAATFNKDGFPVFDNYTCVLSSRSLSVKLGADSCTAATRSAETDASWRVSPPRPLPSLGMSTVDLITRAEC